MTDVLMPRLSDTMEEGVLAAWRKHEGDPVHRGDVLAEIETDKAAMELEAYDDGVLTRLLVGEGTTVPIGTPIAVIDPGGGTPSATAETTAETTVVAPPAAPPAESPPPPAQATGARGEALRASPLARRIAREHGLDLATIPGSGPGGRIVRADIDAAIAGQAAAPPSPVAPPAPPVPPVPEPATRPVSAAPAGPDTEEIPLTRVRRLTAERLADSAQQAPHFFLTRTVDADALLAFRVQVNRDLADAGIRVSITDLLVKACAQALIAHPEVNSSWAGTRLLRHHRVHVGIAVALDDGLIVPVIHDADRKTVSQISREARDLADRARNGRVSVDEITGGTFTISNLGMYGIDQFTAVINPPEAAILAVGAAAPGPVVRDGGLTVATTMTLTLSIDHRVLDGAGGARFLADLAAMLEHPTRIVL
ncbi:dihydrolipoamide acetyltransferase family protein [Amycolatopsis cynarae]|uniref:Dihydrolipoamide acetyltransferase component of pyruvate dehydrogenase complex n=1 Tax=Amycolatopsis cynarae TaxID=2995223 RepID=A0ABY7B7D5_9PSEU|nr:dihydrolipoamide acetyltransferase family protein [Amycolatopsis sp. HUAS 11-8]WAL67865.1 dihydrolipoamide acetyltransferase family protein [Amycolatopsis sp. HUAS 11-8]